MNSLNNILQYYNLQSIINSNQSTTKKNIKINENFLDLSLNTIFYNLSYNILSIFNDLINKKPTNFNDIQLILTKNNRLIYFGLFIILISFVIYFIDFTS